MGVEVGGPHQIQSTATKMASARHDFIKTDRPLVSSLSLHGTALKVTKSGGSCKKKTTKKKEQLAVAVLRLSVDPVTRLAKHQVVGDSKS